MYAFWIFLAFFAGATAGYLLLRSKLSAVEARIEERGKAMQAERQGWEAARETVLSDIREERARADSKAQEIIELTGKLCELQATISERENALNQERSLLADLKQQFKSEFADLSATALRENREDFLAAAKRELSLQQKDAEMDLARRQEEIGNLVKPIEEGIAAVSKATREMEEKREHAYGSIEEQLRHSVVAAGEVARQTAALKDALKKPNVRGRWGEVQLHNCVELAGMEDHCDVEFQVSSTDDQGDGIRPDMIVRMPGGRRIAVDAKTPMQYFLEYIESSTDESRQASLLKHGRAVKNHVAGLARADYMQKLASSPDFVIMFLPNESFLAMAMEHEPGIIEHALSKKVLITTPGTLIGLLKVIRYGWNEEKLARNAQKIADAGARLNTEIHRFVDDFVKIESALASASDALQSSKRRVENQIAKASGNLTALGATSKKLLKGKAAEMLHIEPEEDNGARLTLVASSDDSRFEESLFEEPLGN